MASEWYSKFMHFFNIYNNFNQKLREHGLSGRNTLVRLLPSWFFASPTLWSLRKKTSVLSIVAMALQERVFMKIIFLLQDLKKLNFCIRVLEGTIHFFLFDRLQI